MYIQNITKLPVQFGTDGSLSEAYLDFLNPAACQDVNPCGRTFWPDLRDKLAAASEQVEGFQRSNRYRIQLEPYLLRRVHLTAGTWQVDGAPRKGLMCLCLSDVRLAHVYGPTMGESPDVYVDHIHITVSSSWYDRVRPDRSEALAVNGMLYEYADRRGRRNVGVIAVAVMPRSRKRRAARAA